jgi:hypothetical protein
MHRFVAEYEDTLLVRKKTSHGRNCGPFSGRDKILRKSSAFLTEY